MSDDELIKFYKLSKDVDCVGELYKRYTGFTFSICMKYLRNTEKSREAVLEIFESLIEKILIHDISNFKSWLHSVARNHCLLSFRAKRSEDSFSEDYIKHQNFTDNSDFMTPEYISKEKNYKKLEESIHKLKEEQRHCIELFYLQNKSYVEVSQITGFTMKEVKTHIQNGKRNLKNLMENNND